MQATILVQAANLKILRFETQRLLRHAAINLSFSEVQMIGEASFAVMYLRTLSRTVHLVTSAMMTMMVARMQVTHQQSKIDQVLAKKKKSRDGNKVVTPR